MGSVPRGSHAIALPLAHTDPPYGRRRGISRSHSSSSTDSLDIASINSSRRPMAIPGTRTEAAPPPLPPPRYVHELANGHDLAWRFENRESTSHTGLPPIKEGSSLLGGFSKLKQQSAAYRRSMEFDHDGARDHGSNTSIAHAAAAAAAASASATPAPLPLSAVHQPSQASQHSTVHRAASPTTSAMLHGERPLAQENIHRSNQAYDQTMLSKIGKSNSPPRQLRGGSEESPIISQKLSLQTKDMKAYPPPTANELSATTTESTHRWPASPASNSASPFSRQHWRDHTTNPRSPAVDGASQSMALDPELFVHQPASHRSTTSPNTGVEDPNSRSGRSSYDQNMYTTTSDSFDGALEDQKSDRGNSHQGQKRKSPPSEEDRPQPHLYARLATRLASHSPTSNPHPQQGSVASTPSSAQPSSYNSSGVFSAAPGSMTSLSSFGTQSPKEILHSGPYFTPVPPVSSPSTIIAPRKTQDKVIPRTMPAQPGTEIRPAARIGNHYICACCPKKPKKFDTEDQLRLHENEKQYSCNFCHNRFKNKNEAERHQNSLHLRRHSWACAALNNYQAAFNPSGAVESESTAADACGYCGEEFPNFPSKNWELRIEHLTNVHKFGECNSSKKFFRADHFRQHLKHSHNGKSGKWTNILEHACVRDELPPEASTYQITACESPSTPARGPNIMSVQMDQALEASMNRQLMTKSS